MLERTIVIDKLLGETPLQALERLRQERPELREIRLAYAGRLDPLATGALLVVIGEECTQYNNYLGLDKEYEVEILLGVGTDTGDTLGIVDQTGALEVPSLPREEQVQSVLGSLLGPHKWPYPIFSSKPVSNNEGEKKPLFLWALEDRLSEIEIPLTKTNIQELELLDSYTLSAKELHERITLNISSVRAVEEESKLIGRDFRRTEILAAWVKYFSSTRASKEYLALKVKVRCTSGSYMRTLAEQFGQALGTRALALSIHRTRIFTP